jgi:hypothetical protein
MSGVQTQVGTGNGTRAGRPAIKAKNKRKRRTASQIAAAAQQPAKTDPAAAATKLPRDRVLLFADRTRTEIAEMAPAEQTAVKAWLAAAYGLKAA